MDKKLIRQLFQELKEISDKQEWSRGVSLSRKDGMVLLQDSKQTSQLQIPDLTGPLIRTISLHWEDLDWQCTCGRQFDPCLHVIAGCMAMRNASEGRMELSRKARSQAGLAYEIKQQGSEYFLHRGVVSDVGNGLSSNLSWHLTEENLLLESALAKQDIKVEDTMIAEIARRSSNEGFTRTQWGEVLSLLSQAEASIFYQGIQVKPESEATIHELNFSRQSEGFFVNLKKPELQFESQKSGLCLIKGNLESDPARLILQKTVKLSPEKLESLLNGEMVPFKDLDLFYRSVVIPLKTSCQLVGQLFKTVAEDPYLFLESEECADPGFYLVTVHIGYGSPQLAVVNAEGHLICNSEILPQRKQIEEDKLVRFAEEKLHQSPGVKNRLSLDQTMELKAILDGSELGSVFENTANHLEISGELKPQVSLIDDILKLDFVSDSDGRNLAIASERVLKAWDEGSSLLKSEEGTLWRLPSVWLQEHAEILTRILGSRDASGKIEKAVAIANFDYLEQLGVNPGVELGKLALELKATREMSSARLPAGLEAELRDYQEFGVAWLQKRLDSGVGALLADDMGLGKTLQTLTLLTENSLVVAPASVLVNWQREIQKFRPNLKVNLYHGPKRTRSAAGVLVTSYSILRMEHSYFSNHGWDMIVCDEAQNFKNPQSSVAKAVYDLKAKSRLALTGTPIENSLEELWSLFHFLNRGLLGTFSHFQKNVSAKVAKGDPKSLLTLHKTTSPFILRRLKSEVAKDLPPKTESTLLIDLSDRERQVYTATASAARAEIEELLGPGMDGQGKTIQALELLLRMRQAACHTGLLPGDFEEIGSSKTQVLGERLQTLREGNQKALVFSQWTGFLDLIGRHLDSLGLNFLRLDGSTQDRQGVVDEFQNNSENRILLMSLKAGGVGLNLTAADQVYIMDPWWNPAAEQQAADRAYRIGQEKPVFVYRMVAGDTVEEKIQELKKKKLALAEGVLAGKSAIKGLSAKDILNLIEG